MRSHKKFPIIQGYSGFWDLTGSWCWRAGQRTTRQPTAICISWQGMKTATENSTWQAAHCEENTPAAAALVTGWNCTKAAVTPFQLLYNLLWHERKTRTVCGMDTEAL